MKLYLASCATLSCHFNVGSRQPIFSFPLRHHVQGAATHKSASGNPSACASYASPPEMRTVQRVASRSTIDPPTLAANGFFLAFCCCRCRCRHHHLPLVRVEWKRPSFWWKGACKFSNGETRRRCVRCVSYSFQLIAASRHTKARPLNPPQFDSPRKSSFLAMRLRIKEVESGIFWVLR